MVPAEFADAAHAHELHAPLDLLADVSSALSMVAEFRELGVQGVIFVPEQTSQVKIDAIRGYGGDVRFFGTDGLDTEQHARAYAQQHGMYYVSPYNDAAVIAGQGTCAVEIARQLPDAEAAFVANESYQDLDTIQKFLESLQQGRVVQIFRRKVDLADPVVRAGSDFWVDLVLINDLLMPIDSLGVTIAFAITLGILDSFFAWWFRQAFNADSEIIFLGIAAAIVVVVSGGYITLRNRI